MDPTLQIESLQFQGGNPSGSGAVAQRLMAGGFRVESLRPCDVLRKDEWIDYDTAVIEQARERLGAVADLLSRGLRYGLPNALGKTRIEWEKVGDMTPANVSMSGVTPGEGDRMLFELDFLPVPIIHKDFHINIRTLMASRTTGEALDTMQARMASRLVSEKIEDQLFNGGLNVGSNGQIYGYLTHPNRNTGSVTASWLTATGEQIVADVLSMITAAQADNMFGPYVVYVPIAVHTKMGDDYKANSDKTILQRVQEIPGIGAVIATQRMAAPNVLLVQTSTDVVDIVDGIQPTPIQWETNGGMTVNFKVMAIMLPRIKADKIGQCGVVHFS